ncbi:MAG TPA: hypothetical protein VI299_13090 [Polyangiales bacterium]
MRMAGWSEAKCAGYALAALVAGDRELAAASAIPEHARTRTRALVAHDGADKTPRDSAARRQLVEHLLGQVRPALALDGSLPVRVHEALVRGPRARVGSAIANDLWPRLHRIARYHRPVKP